jgi:hypothetical protein
MVFFALKGNEPVNAQDIKSKTKEKFNCCDPDCDNPELTFIMSHLRTITKTSDDSTTPALSFNVDISSHFKHCKNTNCSFENFINELSTPNREFYRFWTSFFTWESIKNTFNSESKFHVLYEDIMIQTSHKQLKPDQIKKKEHYGTNNRKVIWILQVNDETRNELNNLIIKRNYWSDIDNIVDTKYYITSNSKHYYDLELFDLTKSEVYLDINSNKLLKLINLTFQGFEVEPVLIKTFFKKSSKIMKPNYELPDRSKLKIESQDIHINILNKTTNNYLKMQSELKKFKEENEFTHTNSSQKNNQYYDLYCELTNKYNVYPCEIVQNNIYENKTLSDYSFECLRFIWSKNDDNYESNIKPMDCSICNKNYQGNILTKNYCLECLNFKNEHNNFYEIIINNPEYIYQKYHNYDFCEKLWKINGKSFDDFCLSKLNKHTICINCIKNNFRENEFKNLKLCKNCNINKIKEINEKIINNEKTHKINLDISLKYLNEKNLCRDCFSLFNKIYDENKIRKQIYYEYHGVKLDEVTLIKLCESCMKNINQKINYDYEYNYLKNIDPSFKYTNKTFSQLLEIWESQNDNIYDFLRKNKKNEYLCNTCLINNYKYDTVSDYENICKGCSTKNSFLLYNEIKFSGKSKLNFDDVLKLANENKEDYFFWYRRNKFELCNGCIKEKFSNPNFSSLNCNNCQTIKNNSEIYKKIRKAKKIDKKYAFDDLIQIWELNNDSFYSHLKLRYGVIMCNNCLKKKFHNNKYENNDCQNCNKINR